MGYDSHFILDALVKIRKKNDVYVKVLPKNEEQYRAIYAKKEAVSLFELSSKLFLELAQSPTPTNKL